ncbi:MAG: hypothetical protein ACKO81_08985 [Planctomycetota bacterium]
MSRLHVCGLLIGFVVFSGGLVSGQDCGCSGAAVGGHRHFWPGPCGGPNCGRGFNQAQAESLWAGYCTEDCSLCGGGLGAGCGTGFLGGCGGNCGPVAGPFAGLAQVHQAHHGAAGPGGQRGNHFTGGPFAGGHFSKLGLHQHGSAGSTAPCSMGGKAFGRSISCCQQWGWGNCGSGCGCGGCDSGNGGIFGQLHEVGKCGRLFQSTGCDSSGKARCDAGCDSPASPVSYSNSNQATQPNQAATPTSFHRYHSGK